MLDWIKYTVKVNFTYFYLIFNVATRKFQITYVACIVFLLYCADQNQGYFFSKGQVENTFSFVGRMVSVTAI